MIRKRAIALLGMALLVGASGFAAQAHTVKVERTATVNQQDCSGGWINPDSGTCEFEAP
jgi:hypothetical protein